MGEPIRLWKDNKELTVHGAAEANELVAHGWAVGPKPAVPEKMTLKRALEGASPVPSADEMPEPAADAAPPEPAAKPAKKRDGEYGSGAGTQRVVNAEKIAEVKAERAEGDGGK